MHMHGGGAGTKKPRLTLSNGTAETDNESAPPALGNGEKQAATAEKKIKKQSLKESENDSEDDEETAHEDEEVPEKSEKGMFKTPKVPDPAE